MSAPGRRAGTRARARAAATALATLLLAPAAGSSPHAARGAEVAEAPATAPAPAAPVDPVKSAWNEARRLADSARYDSSLAVLRGALRRGGDNVELRWLLAGVTGEAGRHRESVALYRRLAVDHPEVGPDLHGDLATQLLWAGDPAGAVREFDLWLSANPNDGGARRRRALALAHADRLRESLAAYDELRSSDPGDTDFALERARVLGWLGRHRDAIAAYGAILERDPANAPARLGLAMNQNWAGRHRRAARELGRIARAPGADPEAWKALAFARYWDGDAAGAHRALDEYLGRMPADREGRQLARRIEDEWSPSVQLAYERADDSDGLRVGTTTTELRWPSRRGTSVLIGWRRDNVRDAGGTRDPLQFTAGVSHAWNPVWSANASFTHTDWGDSGGTPSGGELGVTCRPADRARFDASVWRAPVITRRSLQLGISVLAWDAGGDLKASERLDLHVNGRAAYYSDHNRSERMGAKASLRTYSGSRGEVDLTLATEQLNTRLDLDHGYYDPDFYREWGPGAEAEWRPRESLTLGLAGQTGWQREKGGTADPFYSLAVRAQAVVGRWWTLELEGGRSNSNLQNDTGYERKHWQAALTRGF